MESFLFSFEISDDVEYIEMAIDLERYGHTHTSLSLFFL